MWFWHWKNIHFLRFFFCWRVRLLFLTLIYILTFDCYFWSIAKQMIPCNLGFACYMQTITPLALSCSAFYENMMQVARCVTMNKVRAVQLRKNVQTLQSLHLSIIGWLICFTRTIGYRNIWVQSRGSHRKG